MLPFVLASCSLHLNKALGKVCLCCSPVGEEVLSAVACLQVAGSVACLGQRAAVQTEAVAEVLASFRKVGAAV